MKKKAPLMVVATLDPKSVGEQALARYSTPEGDFITTAGMKFVFSPYTGKEVSASLGKQVATTINGDKAVGVICQSCKSINATTNTSRSHMFCVTCGTHLSYNLDTEALDDEAVEDILDEQADLTEFEDKDMIGGDEPDMDDEADVDMDADELDEEVEDAACSKKTKAEVEVSDDETLEDTESEASDEGDDEDDVQDAGPLDEFMQSQEEASEDDTVVEMTDMVDEDEEVEFVDVESKVLAMVSGYVVATMESDNANAHRVTTSAFQRGFKHTVATGGLHKALVSAGFKTKRILVKDVVAAATKRADKEVLRKVEASLSKNTQRFAECLEIATAGGMIGMFSKEKASVLFDEMASVFASMNIANPKKVARNVLAKALAQHNKAVINVATDLMKREDAVLSSYREQIASMGGVFAEVDDSADEVEEEVVDETVESRLVNPMRMSGKPAKRAVEASHQVKGLSLTNLFAS